MADVHYYVSIQNGDDSNDGLTPETAWATMTKAAQTVRTPDVGNRHIIHWGPGTYREKISFSYAGRSMDEMIIYAPDPNCLWLTGDRQGRCRLTGCDESEMASSGNTVNFNSKDYVQFGDFDAECWVDGTARTAVYGGNSLRVCIRVNARAGDRVFEDCTTYCCTAQGGYYGFIYGTAYNCAAQGGYRGFYSCTAYNCTAQGGFYGFYSGTAYNCTAQGCNLGFGYGTAYNCAAQGGSYGFEIGRASCRERV